jgi:hypothetical protein
MIEKINCQDLIVLIAVLFIVFYFTTIFKKENFDNIINSDMKTINRKNKSCSQDSINTTIKDYIFSTLPSTR